MGEAAEEGEVHRSTLVLGQLAKGGMHRLVHVPAGHGCLVGRDRINLVVAQRAALPGSLDPEPLAAACAQAVDGPVADDAHEPGHDPALVIRQGANPIPENAERIQHHGLGFRLVVEHPLGDAKQPWRGKVDELLEGALVACDEALPKRGGALECQGSP